MCTPTRLGCAKTHVNKLIKYKLTIQVRRQFWFIYRHPLPSETLTHSASTAVSWRVISHYYASRTHYLLLASSLSVSHLHRFSLLWKQLNRLVVGYLRWRRSFNCTSEDFPVFGKLCGSVQLKPAHVGSSWMSTGRMQGEVPSNSEVFLAGI